MKYAAIIEYIQDTDRVTAARPRHREYLSALKADGRLFMAGPFPDGSGALIVYEAESPEAAERLLADDPFRADGVFQTWVIRPWNQVF